MRHNQLFLFFLSPPPGTHCLGTPAGPQGMTLLSAPHGIPVNQTAEYGCANGMKFEADFEQVSVAVTCLVENQWDSANVDYGNCVESKGEIEKMYQNTETTLWRHQFSQFMVELILGRILSSVA